MDKKTWIAVSICFLVYFDWQKLYVDPNTHRQQNAIQNSTAPVNSVTGAAVTTAPILSPSHVASATAPQKLLWDAATGTVTLKGGSLDKGKLIGDWTLRDYRLGLEKETSAVDLNEVLHQEGAGEIAFESPEYGYLSDAPGNWEKINLGSSEGYRWTREDDKVKITKELSSPANQNWMDFKISADFKGVPPKYLFISISSYGPKGDSQEDKDRRLMYFTNNSMESKTLSDLNEVVDVKTPVRWIAATNRYFLMTFIYNGALEPHGLLQPLQDRLGRASLVFPVAGKSLSIPMRVYFGPRELNSLSAVDPTLDHAIDFGWFTLFAYPLLKYLKWIYQFVHNYGIAIILLTLSLKIVTYPLTYKSMKSMREMAKLQPQLARLKERHKDDKEALNREMMGLMKNHGYNPVAGCLPILVQMPVFFALYRVLYSSIELYHAPFLMWIHDLASKDPYYVTPVLLTVTMFLQQKLTPNTATDPMQAKMMQFMPIFFGLFMISLPSGLTIYMLTNALASIVQQLILNKKLGMPHAPMVASQTK